MLLGRVVPRMEGTDGVAARAGAGRAAEDVALTRRLAAERRGQPRRSARAKLEEGETGPTLLTVTASMRAEAEAGSGLPCLRQEHVAP
jgi:hypothetical protein